MFDENQSIETIRQIAIDINKECTLKNPACYQNSISEKLLSTYSTAQILNSISDFDTYFSCHAFTHYLGRALYEKTGSVPDAYSQINFTCHGGTYHGVIEAFLNDRPDKLINFTGTDIEKTCEDSKAKTDKNPAAVFTECLHGFGHAFMFVTNSDLPESLTLCDQLKPELQERCWGGAFMENSTSSTNRDHPTVWLKDSDKFYPCTILNQKYLNQCYFYQANYLIMTTNHNFKSVFNDCYTLPLSHQNYCIMGIGASLASLANETSIEKAASVCSIAAGYARNICIEGAVPSMMQRWGGQAEKIIEFCQASGQDPSHLCFVKLGYVYKSWHGEDKWKNFCSSLKSFKNDCLGESEVKLSYF